jgi:hypothetical protein
VATTAAATKTAVSTGAYNEGACPTAPKSAAPTNAAITKWPTAAAGAFAPGRTVDTAVPSKTIARTTLGNDAGTANAAAATTEGARVTLAEAARTADGFVACKGHIIERH